MELATNADIPRQTVLIEDGLEGKWVLETESENKQYLTFFKPEESGEWSKLTLSTAPDIIEYQTLEYRVIVPDITLAFIDVRVKTANQIIQYQIDFLNSWEGSLWIKDGTGLFHYYKRVEPRQVPIEKQPE